MTDQQTQQLLNLKRQLEVISSELHTLRTCLDTLRGKVKTLRSSLDSLTTWLPVESREHEHSGGPIVITREELTYYVDHPNATEEEAKKFFDDMDGRGIN